MTFVLRDKVQTQMRWKDWHISVQVDSVHVESSYRPAFRRSRTLACAALFALSIWLVASTFRPDRYGYTLWRYLENYPKSSRVFTDHLVPLIFLAIEVGFFVLCALRMFFPSGETLHCDRHTLVVSRIPLTSFRGKWKTRTFPVSEISELHYGVVQSGGRGHSSYGILFCVCGMEEKMLAGLEPPEAHRILKAMSGLGANVSKDGDMRYLVRESLRDRRAEL